MNPTEETLKLVVANAEESVTDCKKKFFSILKELGVAETNLVEAREEKLKAEATLYEFQTTKMKESSLEDHRERQISEYKEKMPALLKLIENEKPIPFRTITDLDTIKAWPTKK